MKRAFKVKHELLNELYAKAWLALDAYSKQVPKEEIEFDEQYPLLSKYGLKKYFVI
jgi:hypothetical protein